MSFLGNKLQVGFLGFAFSHQKLTRFRRPSSYPPSRSQEGDSYIPIALQSSWQFRCLGGTFARSLDEGGGVGTMW